MPETIAPIHLANFRSIRPRLEGSQEMAIDWLAAAHTVAESRARGGDPSFVADEFRDRIGKFLRRFGCSPEKIARRSTEIGDFFHTDWERMEVFNLLAHPQGAGMEARAAFQMRVADSVFDRLYPEDAAPPADLIHVTCTGYGSPSAPQRLVSARGWGRMTRTTHVYHMGCYASIPAIRVAAGFVSAPAAIATTGSTRRADVVHTELCTLHFNPAVHTPEQIVVQSLFADGHIGYSVVAGEPAGPAYALLAVREEVVPGTADDMTWVLSDWGMRMTLSRDVPDRIADAAREYFCALYGQAGLDFDALRGETVFAVHPGGPKIINRVQEFLALDDAQVAASREVLHDRGNMSSATLPHIWERILADPAVRPGTPVASVAFGPGLTIAGALLRKTETRA